MQIASRISSWTSGGTPTPPAPAYWGLYFEAEEDNVVVSSSFNQDWQSKPRVSLEYSVDGETWTSWNNYGSSPVTLASTGDRVYFRAGSSGNTYLGYVSGGSFYGFRFSLTGKCGAHGNIMSLLNATNESNTTLTATYTFSRLFYNCTSLSSAPELPATTLMAQCYYQMFYGCTSLTDVQALPATTLANYCYTSMFFGCTSLTDAPALPATTLATGCYNSMFWDCRALATAPALPATTLADRCYNQMFYNCSALVTAPHLPATTLVSECYNNLFYGCSSLVNISVSFTAWNPANATSYWIWAIPAAGTFTCPAALGTNETITRGDSNCPSGWTVVNT